MKHNLHCLIKSTIFVAAAICTPLTLSSAKEAPITDFNPDQNETLDWRIVDDGVMGGLSQGQVSFTDQGTMRFKGNLSLENNGGFSSVRTSKIDLDLSESEGIAMRVRGDGRKYQVRLSTDARYRSSEVSFKADFPTTKGEWREVAVPFKKIVASWRGRSLENAFDPSKIQRVTLLLGDKKAGPFALEVDWIRAYGPDSGVGSATSSKSIIDTALADGRFSTLATALTEAELVEALQGDGPFTVLAPTDEAFAKLPDGTLSKLLGESSRDTLRSILNYHVISGSAKLGDALKLGTATTLQGESVQIAFIEGRIGVNEASLVNADIQCSNGIIHVIDAVLLPPVPKPKSILETAKEAGKFETLLAALEATGLVSALTADGPFTVFAPTDAAVGRLPESAESLLLEENREKLEGILKYHVVKGRISAGDALNSGQALTLGGESLEFAVSDGLLKVNGSTISTVDLECSNGMIHIIDQVLIPANVEKVSVVRPGPAQQIISAIGKGVPLYNSGRAAACATVYQECAEELVSNETVNSELRNMLSLGLDRAKKVDSASSRAWMLRRNLDQAMSRIHSSSMR